MIRSRVIRQCDVRRVGNGECGAGGARRNIRFRDVAAALRIGHARAGAAIAPGAEHRCIRDQGMARIMHEDRYHGTPPCGIGLNIGRRVQVADMDCPAAWRRWCGDIDDVGVCRSRGIEGS